MEPDKNSPGSGGTALRLDAASYANKPQRETWRGSADFFLSCVGAAVGLGNIWRFPYLCYKNGGGSFLIPYLVVLVCAGVPLFFLEIALGQYMSRGGIGAWDICPVLRGVGFGCTVIISLCNIYYIILLAWALVYMYFSLNWTLPWATCDNWWNTPRCTDGITSMMQQMHSNTSQWTVNHVTSNISLRSDPSYQPMNSSNLSLILGANQSTPGTVDAATEFWERRVLQISAGVDDPGGLCWELVLALICAWCLVYFSVWKGVKVAGKVVYFTALFPYVVLTILLVRGVTLPGAADGLIFYLKPDFSKLASPQVWVDAGTQVFYSTVLGVNMLIALGSYNKFNNDCYKDCIALVCINSCTSLYAGVAVFSVLGFMAKQQGVSVAEVAESGPGLVFIAYPKAIIQMPVAPLWSLLFFFMIVLVGLDSEFVGVEAIMRICKDTWPGLYKGWRHELLTAAYVLISLCIGLSMVTRGGMYVFQLFDYYSCSGMALMWACLCETVAIGWIYGADRFYDNIAMMIGYRINPWLKICWYGITPCLLIGMFVWYCSTFTVLVYNRHYVYPLWAQGLGMCLAFSSMVCVPVYAVYILLTSPGDTLKQKWQYACTPVLAPERIPPHWPDRAQLRAHHERQRARRGEWALCGSVWCAHSQARPATELRSLKS